MITDRPSSPPPEPVARPIAAAATPTVPPTVPPAALTTLYALSIAAAICFPRLNGLAIAVMTVAALAGLAIRRTPLRRLLPTSPAVPLALAFAAFAGLSALWSPVPVQTVQWSAHLALLVLGVHLAVRSAEDSDRPSALACARGILIAILIAGALTSFELVSGNAIRIAVIDALDLRQTYAHQFEPGGGVVGMYYYHGLRSLVIWLLPAVMIATLLGGWRAAALVALATYVVIVTALSDYQAALAAMLAAALVLLVARRLPVATFRLLATGWVAAFVLALPIAIALHAAGLATSPQLPSSFQIRVDLWKHAADGVIERPILGLGARATKPLLHQTMNQPPGALADRTGSRPAFPHTHSIYLEAWYELGVIGAALLLAAGLAVVFALRTLAATVRPWAYAHFAGLATLLAFDTSFWDPRMQWAVAGSIVAIAIAGRLSRADGPRAKTLL